MVYENDTDPPAEGKGEFRPPNSAYKPAQCPCREAAHGYAGEGYSVVPVMEDGSKRTDGPWKEYQTKRATPARINQWFGRPGTPPKRTGLGIVCGEVSGGLVVFDYDQKAELYPLVVQTAEMMGLGDLARRIEEGCSVRTGGGGIQQYVRCPEKVVGNLKLAQRGTRDPTSLRSRTRRRSPPRRRWAASTNRSRSWARHGAKAATSSHRRATEESTRRGSPTSRSKEAPPRP